jgi:hypothetical protein
MNSEKESSSDPILDSMMSAEEYSLIQHETPYVFRLASGSKELTYFGTRHIRDPKDPLFAEIEQALDQAKPDIVFVEGVSVSGDKNVFNNKIEVASREEIIEKMGESGFLVRLAVEKGIKWHSPEPSDQDLYNYLLEKGFSKDQIFTWEVFHVLPQYNRLLKHMGFKEYVQPFIYRFKESTNWENFDYSYERAIDLGEQILNKKIDVESSPDALDYIDPIPWKEKVTNQTVLNRISETSSLFRDRKIVSDIADGLRTHNKIFVLYGASHAVVQETALKKIFEAIN